MLPRPRLRSRGSVSLIVRAIRTTREVTTGGALPSASIALTRLSEARMSCSVGAAGDRRDGVVVPAPPSAQPRLQPHVSLRLGQLVRREVEGAGGVAGVVLLDPVEVGLATSPPRSRARRWSATSSRAP